MWVYSQRTGEFSNLTGQVLAVGYSGADAGRNNPAMERVVNVGPIPRGRYSIGYPFDSEAFGPVVMHLDPYEETHTFGRGGFLIHGDALSHPGHASHGCIVLPRPVRLAIAGSPDRELLVTE